MTEFLQIGNISVSQAELLPLLRRYQLLPRLVRELAIDRAIADIECSDGDRIAALKQLYDREGLTSEERLEEWLALYHLERHQLTEIAERNFKIEKFKQQTWGNKTESYFLKRKAKLDKAIYSLIRTSDLGIAQEIYFRSIDGEQTFAELAREYSQGAEAQTGGLIGPVELGTPHPVIAELISTQPMGTVCPPVLLEPWYVIVRPERLIPAQLDEPMRQRLIDELFQTWLQAQV
ncbi:peptidylprolyl isomerase [Chamaesiphon minutus]|uniref:peptidylprolyl isomerase n=1 Tax=Chamaesiphon minutus (strain ATCC 27169 / PCC 6605) TaxID=1173020 RepID=K9UA68_CHAP6|nr:peptidylprolyl isomerase [Chamaesiphon minutus]AFY92007.1 parvulin-like peptidyl-prolyl isomerase [Chamaesiphon minutus PCC 6605]